MAKSLIRIIKINAYSVIFAIFFLILFPPVIAIFLLIYILRFIVSQARKLFRRDLGKLVQTRSAVLAGTDDPTSDPNWILCVWLVLEGSVDFELFRHNFYNNIVLKKNPNGELHSPEFQQYFTKWMGFMFWKWEEKFDICDHMHHLNPLDKDKVVCEEELPKIIKKYTWEPFREKKSPWEFLFIQKYKDKGSGDVADKCALIFRVHHGFCDGFGILHLLLTEVCNISTAGVAKPKRKKRSWIYRMIQGDIASNIFAPAMTLLFWIACPYLFMKMMVRSADKNEIKKYLTSDKITKPFNTSFTHRIPLSYIKEIKNMHKVSFSAVIYASITGALRSMMVEMGKKVPHYLTTAVAVPMPGHPMKLRNHFIFSFLQLPTGVEDPLKRLRKMEKNIKQLKRSPVPLFNFALIPVVGGVFPCIMKLFSPNTYSTVLTSNFPGPPKGATYTDGIRVHKVLDMNFSAGLGEGDVGIGFCMLSYDEGIRIITSFAPELMATDELVDLFNQKVLDEMERLKWIGGTYV